MAAWGVAYSLGKRWIPGPRPVRGMLLGGLVWAVNHLGILPRTNLYRPASHDAPDSPFGALLLGHLIDGLTLAAVDDRLAGQRRGEGEWG